jgi:hypothetical protein
MQSSNLLVLLPSALPANAQTLLEVICNIPEFSNLSAFYTTNEGFANSLFGDDSVYPITVLVSKTMPSPPS